MDFRLSKLDGMTSMKISLVLVVIFALLPDVFELDVDDDEDNKPPDELCPLPVPMLKSRPSNELMW